MAEQVIGGGKYWHKRCFTCRACNKGLDSSTLAEHDGEIYCKSCHSKAFGPKGFGYGIGAGALAETSPTQIKTNSGAQPAGPTTQTFSPESNIPKSKSNENLARNPKYMGTDICPRCDKKVYFAEKVIAAGVSWHKACFVCIQCRKGLESTTMTENNGQLYCKACYAKNFGPKGFGYGVGAGALANTQ